MRDRNLRDGNLHGNGSNVFGLLILRAHDTLHIVFFGGGGLRAFADFFGIRRIVRFCLFQRLSQPFDFASAAGILLCFRQRARQHFHVFTGFFLRQLHSLQLVLVHFFLRGRQSVGNRFRLGFFFAGNKNVLFFVVVKVFAVFFNFQILQIVAHVASAGDIRQSQPRVGIDIQQRFVIAFDQIFAQNMQLPINIDQPLSLDIGILFPVVLLTGELRLPFFLVFFGRTHPYSDKTTLCFSQAKLNLIIY